MNDDGGFTLLEVLVALAVLATGMAAAYETLGVGLRAAAAAERRRAAAAAAENMLAELGRTRPLQDGASEGELGDGQRWRLVISPFDAAQPGDAPPVVAAHLVQLQVGSPSEAADAGLLVQTLMLEAAP